MFKGFHIAFSMAIILFMFPGIAWSAPEVPGYPVAQGEAAYTFPARQSVPDPNILLAEANKARKSAGVQPLRANKLLTAIAQQRAADMSVRQYYSHKNPDGLYYYDLINKAGLKPEYSCENLDLVFAYSDPAIIADWLNSTKGHRQCLLKPEAYETGIAIVPYSSTEYKDQRTIVYLVVAIHSTH